MIEGVRPEQSQSHLRVGVLFLLCLRLHHVGLIELVIMEALLRAFWANGHMPTQVFRACWARGKPPTPVFRAC